MDEIILIGTGSLIKNNIDSNEVIK